MIPYPEAERSVGTSSLPSRLFVTGTDTGVGKTLVAGMLAAATGAGYWKPVQTGSREGMDSGWVRRVCGVPGARIAPEAHVFPEPVSPHLAAELAGGRIETGTFDWPKLPGSVIAEGAGGVMVPLNERETVLDLALYLQAQVLVVARTGLGTINHTLLTVDRLRSSGARIFGVVLSGTPNRNNVEAIAERARVPVVAQSGLLGSLSGEAIRGAGALLANRLGIFSFS